MRASALLVLSACSAPRFLEDPGALVNDALAGCTWEESGNVDDLDFDYQWTYDEDGHLRDYGFDFVATDHSSHDAEHWDWRGDCATEWTTTDEEPGASESVIYTSNETYSCDHRGSPLTGHGETVQTMVDAKTQVSTVVSDVVTDESWSYSYQGDHVVEMLWDADGDGSADVSEADQWDGDHLVRRVTYEAGDLISSETWTWDGDRIASSTSGDDTTNWEYKHGALWRQTGTLGHDTFLVEWSYDDGHRWPTGVTSSRSDGPSLEYQIAVTCEP